MKNIIYGLIISCMMSLHISGQTASFGKELIKPDLCQFSSDMGKRACKLNTLLGQSDLKNFYHSVQPLFDEINKMDQGSMSGEDWNDVIWFFYLICGAPLYEVDYTTDLEWLYEEDNDILSKIGVAGFIATFDVQSISKMMGIKENCVKNINSIYFSTIKKTLRSKYIVNVEEKITGLQEEMFKYLKEQPYILQNRLEKLSILERRNTVINSFISSILEEQFVDMLMQYYPNNPGEVLKSVKMAGYEGSEILELIDRTVGRNFKTEYLYQGWIGKEPKKKLKQQHRDK